MLCKFMTFASGWATQHNLLPSTYVDLSPSTKKTTYTLSKSALYSRNEMLDTYRNFLNGTHAKLLQSRLTLCNPMYCM